MNDNIKSFAIKIEVNVERLELCRGEILDNDELLMEVLIQEFGWLHDSGIILTELKKAEENK